MQFECFMNYIQFINVIVKCSSKIKLLESIIAKQRIWIYNAQIMFKCTYEHMYICTINNVKCKMYNIRCTIYNVHIYNHCAMYIYILCTLYIVHCTLYIVHCTLYICTYVLINIYCVLYVKCTMCNVQRIWIYNAQ